MNNYLSSIKLPSVEEKIKYLKLNGFRMHHTDYISNRFRFSKGDTVLDLAILSPADMKLSIYEYHAGEDGQRNAIMSPVNVVRDVSDMDTAEWMYLLAALKIVPISDLLLNLETELV